MRVFWLGMHKVLINTELLRLRSLGFEVFNPPYLSEVKDQSANLDWDYNQESTLPLEIFQMLSKSNFFYTDISSEMAHILNEYFDAVIVSINADWLLSILKVFKGKIIYRTYGETSLVSENLWNNGAAILATNRDNFWFIPHSVKTAELEYSWIRDRMEIVPYHLSEDVFKFESSWNVENCRSEIAFSCPNISNPFFKKHYQYLKKNFFDNRYKYYGVQLTKIVDSQVVGTLNRIEQLKCLQSSAGFMYTYDDPRVCYLPPIEAMIIGLPVIFLPGSLLARYFNGKPPGMAKDEIEANLKLRRILSKDIKFINEITGSQHQVKELYKPSYVNPIFDATFKRILAHETNIKRPITVGANNQSGQSRIYILNHRAFDASTTFRDGKATNREGISRVMRLVARAITENKNCEVVITTRYEYAMPVLSFYQDNISNAQIKILVVNKNKFKKLIFRLRSFLSKTFKKFISMVIKINSFDGQLTILNIGEIRLLEVMNDYTIARYALSLLLIFLSPFVFTYFFVSLSVTMIKNFIYSRPSIRYLEKFMNSGLLSLLHSNVVKTINNDAGAKLVINPHYALFSESIDIKKPVLLYLPDYIPHFYSSTGEFKSEFVTSRLGYLSANAAKRIMTNSQYSRSYIPLTYLRVPKEKIDAFPLPNLNLSSNASAELSSSSEKIQSLIKKLKGRKYIFYPTANRPNKNWILLAHVMFELRKKYKNIAIVLTGDIDSEAYVGKLWRELNLIQSTVTIYGLDDSELEYVYKNSICLCLTSNLEGNFPPQIYEAIDYNVPVVATRIPLIEELLEDKSQYLLLANKNDVSDFVNKIVYVINNRNEILNNQNEVKKILEDKASYAVFKHNICLLIDKTISN